MKQAILKAALLASAAVPCLLFATEPTSNKPIISNDGASLDLTDIDAHLATIPKAARAGVMNDPDRIDQILNQLLILRFAANEARQFGLDKDPVVAREMAIAGERVLFRYRMEKLKADAQLPDFELQAKERYLANPQDYMTPERVNVSHVLLKIEHHLSEDATRKEAEKIRKQALKRPEQFAELAKRYSDDPTSGPQGGKLGMTPVQNFVAPFAEATVKLTEPGQISEVVKSDFGFHVIQFHERIKAELKPFDEVKPKIVAVLREDYLRAIQGRYVDDVKSKKIEADPEAIASLRTRYGELPTPPELPKGEAQASEASPKDAESEALQDTKNP